MSIADGTLFRQKFASMTNAIFIAEVKTESQISGWRSPYSEKFLLEKAVAYGHWVSIHTDPRWGGSFGKIARARRFIEKYPSRLRPKILAKGVHKSDDEVTQALDMGADYVLIVGRIPNARFNPSRCLIEATTLDDLRLIPHGYKAVWNSRDIKNAIRAYERGEKLSHNLERKETFTDALRIWPGWLCQASNIHTFADIAPGANAILVGTHLIKFIESVLAWQPSKE